MRWLLHGRKAINHLSTVMWTPKRFCQFIKVTFIFYRPRVGKIYVYTVPRLVTRQIKACSIPKRTKFSTPARPRSKPWLTRIVPCNWTKKFWKYTRKAWVTNHLVTGAKFFQLKLALSICLRWCWEFCLAKHVFFLHQQQYHHTGLHPLLLPVTGPKTTDKATACINIFWAWQDRKQTISKGLQEWVQKFSKCQLTHYLTH